MENNLILEGVMQSVRLKSRQWLEDTQGNIIIGEGRQRIFELVEQTGSINQAAKLMKMSYRGVWGKIKATEEHLKKKVVITERRHGSRLTEDGKRLLTNYTRLKKDCQKEDEKIFNKIFKSQGSYDRNSGGVR
ncbi:MAG: LysR family transcriptional regulator [Deltaproteobacteria bacterium]|nr:MAG: LysR family transcriptional regulator [Deltaproteobacteria bacterium]